jgi:hypothetical protein
METLFDTGAFTKALPNIRLTAEYVEVADSGNDGVVRLSMLQAYSLDSGEPANALLTSLYVEVLSAVLPASEISGDTNAGVHQDITEFDDGSAPPDPIFLVAHLADDGGLDVLLNTNIATPFIARMTDDSILYARLTLPLHLVAHLEDDGRLNAFSLGLTPIPIVQSIVVMTGR